MRCPQCGSGKIARIVYGRRELSEEEKRQMEAGGLVYGNTPFPGAVQRPFRCGDCRHEFDEDEAMLPSPAEFFSPEELEWMKGIRDSRAEGDAPFGGRRGQDLAGETASAILGLRLWHLGNIAKGAPLTDLQDESFVKLLLMGLRFAVARKQGNAAAALGDMYSDGMPVERDYAEAERWYREGERLGDMDAVIKLGKLYESGLLGAPDNAKACALYTKAALSNEPEALCRLGDMLARGACGCPDKRMAYRLYDDALHLTEEHGKGTVPQAHAAFRVARVVGDREESREAGICYLPIRALELYQLAERCLYDGLKRGEERCGELLQQAREGQDRMREAIAEEIG